MFLPSPNGPPLKIGIYRSSSIGDVVLATACLDLISMLGIPSEVVWLGRQPAIGLLRDAFPKLICIDVGKSPDVSRNSPLLNELAQVHFLVDLQGSLRSRLLASNFKRQFGKPFFTSSKAQWFRSTLIAEARLFGRARKLPVKALTASNPQYRMMLAALEEGLRDQLPAELIDLPQDHGARPYLPTAHDSGQRPWQKELRLGRWLAIAPGASHETKRAPLDVFSAMTVRVRQLLQDQQDQVTFGILIVGDHNDRQFGVKLLDSIGWQGPSLNLAGMISLWETALALRDAQILLSNDSGLGHIAEAVNTPAAVLFGPTVEGFGFSPHLKESLAVSANLGCRPCSKHGKAECRFNDRLCFLNIPQDLGANHLAQAMRRPRRMESDALRDGNETLKAAQIDE